jgi:Fe-S-cluster-containing hydrogenase component 2
VLNKYPSDIYQNVCRQCPVPLCVENCPTGACHVSAENGNVRMIDEAKCIGCQMCLNSCPHRPHRIIWNKAKNKCTKCDMCVNTPYYNKKGGPDGAQACVEACPANSLRVVDEMPEQADLRGSGDQTRGYDRNLQPPPKPGGFGFGPPKAKAGGEAPGAKPGAPGGNIIFKPETGGPGGAPDSKTPPPAKSALGGNQKG